MPGHSVPHFGRKQITRLTPNHATAFQKTTFRAKAWPIHNSFVVEFEENMQVVENMRTTIRRLIGEIKLTLSSPQFDEPDCKEQHMNEFARQKGTAT